MPWPFRLVQGERPRENYKYNSAGAPIGSRTLPPAISAAGTGGDRTLRFAGRFGYSLVMLLSPATAMLAARTVGGSAWAI
jgi:hypothetical protein